MYKIKFLVFMVICLLWNFAFTQQDTKVTELLQSNLRLPIFQQEFFLQNFSSPELLKLDEVFAKQGVEYDGEYTKTTLNKLFMKAFTGENISVLVLGGSSTQGADLGYQNTKSTFHFGLKDWWNNVVAPVTGSYMNRRVIAIGGIGSTYMGLCWKEYIRDLQSIDLVLWEFFINDPDSKDYIRGVERLFTSIRNHPSQPSFLLVRFFTRNIMKCLSNKVCGINTCNIHKMKSNVLKQLCISYKFSMMNLLSTICAYLKTSKVLNINELFISHHPSHLAHAQMAFILIDYIKNKFQEYLTATHPSLTVENIVDNQQTSRDPNTVCWTGVLPSTKYIVPNSIFQLPVRQNYGFQKKENTKWIYSIAFREDVRGGYSTNIAGSRIILSLPVSTTQPYTVYAAISHVVDGGKTQFSVQGIATQNLIEIDCSRKVHSAMSINHIIDNVTGDAEFQMDVLDGMGCVLNAIILEYEESQYPVYNENENPSYNQSVGIVANNIL